MIRKIREFSRKVSIEFKVVVGIVLFTLAMGGMERYQMSQNVVDQFLEAKKSKNLLLLNTIAPILGLNISLGLDGANREYLDYIAKENQDVIFIELKNGENRVVYENANDKDKIECDDWHKIKRLNIDFCDKEIVDSISGTVIGSVNIHFSDNDFHELRSANRLLSLKLALVGLVLLIVFVRIIQREFKHLKELSDSVLAYDPKRNHFALEASDRRDEVGVIQNAIVSMVDKIGLYTRMLDETNLSLEDRIQESTKELREANKRLRALSVTDELTKLSNRRYFEKYFQKTWELAKRQGANVSLIICDIDHFKKVNDTYGHPIGDEVLKYVATALRESLKRNTDFVARYGGEEFVIVMYEANLDDATSLCRRVQENLKKAQDLTFDGVKVDPVTMSFGISSVVPDKESNYESIIKHADDALYKAKGSGRNRIVGY